VSQLKREPEPEGEDLRQFLEAEGIDKLGEPEVPLEAVTADARMTGEQRTDQRYINNLLAPLQGLDPDEDYVIRGVNNARMRRCKIMKRSGERCKAAAMKGQAICKYHGGRSPQAKRKAQLRLATLVDPAIGRLARILVNGTDRDALRAIENVLDRTGFPRRTEVSDVNEARDLLVQYLKEARNRAELGTANVDDSYDGEDYDDDEEEDDEPGSSVIEVQGVVSGSSNDRDDDGEHHQH
jgi:hypothetical protein